MVLCGLVHDMSIPLGIALSCPNHHIDKAHINVDDPNKDNWDLAFNDYLEELSDDKTPAFVAWDYWGELQNNQYLTVMRKYGHKPSIFLRDIKSFETHAALLPGGMAGPEPTDAQRQQAFPRAFPPSAIHWLFEIDGNGTHNRATMTREAMAIRLDAHYHQEVIDAKQRIKDGC